MPDALHPFAYDAFQQRAMDAIDRGVSVFVAAPTGAGKTVIADHVIEQTLARGQRIIYTAPIKALSNQKFRDFSLRHPDQVGIMTGDVTLNAHAPLLIMTTEIYRNTLLEDASRLAAYAWIIFDEVHFLDDAERGTVWEESIMFTPDHIQLLCLSATIPNVEQLAAWIRMIHNRPVEIIEESHRPVPLTIRFQCHNRVFAAEQDLRQEAYGGRAHQPVRHARWRRRDECFDSHRQNRVQSLIEYLRGEDHLPCIFFVFGRRRTEDLAWEVSGLPLLTDAERGQLRTLYAELCARFQLGEDRTAQALGQLIERGVAYHHAGMLPTMKEVVERCFSSRLLKVIVTTETFALGVNMPARSVVLDTVKKRNGPGYAMIRRREFLQMAGRAGRRGMDPEGFVYVRVNPEHVAAPELQQLLHGDPEPVQSRFNTAYATLINLYRGHGQALLGLFPRTLYHYQTTGTRRQEGLELMQRKLELLTALGYLTGGGLTQRGEFAAYLYGYELLLTELQFAGHLSALDPLELALLLAAQVYEPRPTAEPPKRHKLSERLAELCQDPLNRIHREEHKRRISPRTKSPAFHLSHAVEAWMSRAPFHKLSKYSDVDEGELVRYFRMTVQLLRQLGDLPGVDAGLRANARKARERINRDVVDAEAQLRLG